VRRPGQARDHPVSARLIDHDTELLRERHKRDERD
jgi:hypothetical protein